MKPPSGRKSAKAILLGLGLDNKDGHKRVTRGENFLLLDGSQETHERMTEKAIKFNEKLKSRGKALEEVTKDEFFEIAHEIDM
ncbi:MAG: hypothetical protein N2689_01055 [Verrucomicrobiae bacterium]|nr:hypothetical protein [Verrucomicrobiae bacterium]